jgi:hopanoid biosynthesis associated protein HpnK
VSRFLIVTADDFGLHIAVNEAVERASRAGVLTAASLMVAGPAAADAVRRAKELPQLRVGLHLVLADGHAVLPRGQIPALIDAHGRFGDHMFVDGVRFFALPKVRRQLEAEIRAQFQAFTASGLRLDHVNAHKHFHLHPTLLAMLLRIGRDYGLGNRHSKTMVGMRVPAEPLWAGSAGSILLAPWLMLMKHRLRRAGIPHNDHVFGMGSSGKMNEERLLGILARLPPGVSEIYLHPATQSGTDIAASMEGYCHTDEFEALMSLQIKAAMTAMDLSRGGFSDLSNTTACAQCAQP